MPVQKHQSAIALTESANPYVRTWRVVVRRFGEWGDSIYPISPGRGLPIALGVALGAFAGVGLIFELIAPVGMPAFEHLVLATGMVNLVTAIMCSADNLRGQTGATRIAVGLLAPILIAVLCGLFGAVAVHSADRLWQITLLGIASAPLHVYGTLR